MSDDIPRALMGSHQEPQVGEPAGMDRIRQRIFQTARALHLRRQECDVAWLRIMGLRGAMDALIAAQRESVAFPTSDSAVPALMQGNEPLLPPPPLALRAIERASEAIGDWPRGIAGPSIPTVDSFQRMDTSGNLSAPALTAS